MLTVYDEATYIIRFAHSHDVSKRSVVSFRTLFRKRSNDDVTVDTSGSLWWGLSHHGGNERKETVSIYRQNTFFFLLKSSEAGDLVELTGPWLPRSSPCVDKLQRKRFSSIESKVVPLTSDKTEFPRDRLPWGIRASGYPEIRMICSSFAAQR